MQRTKQGVSKCDGPGQLIPIMINASSPNLIWERPVRRAIMLPFLAALLFSLVNVISAPSPLESTMLRFDPATIELGPEYCVGETFTLAVRIENVEYLYGFDIKIAWNTTYIEYVDHLPKIPIEAYPDGVLHEPILVVKNEANTSKGWCWLAVTSLAPAPSFNGSGTAFEITFRVKYQPIAPEPDAEFQVRHITHDLADLWSCCGIVHDVAHCDVIIHAYEEPPSPPVGGTSVSIDISKFPIWVTLTLLLLVVITTFQVQWNRRRKN